MIENKPTLLLNRLIVTSGGYDVYDETFHEGLNIIRGQNSSGKSTILDFIFYAFGGDVKVWKSAASRCNYVTAEVSLNGAVLTLQREVVDSSQSPMAIFWGNIEDSKKSRLKGWSQYPYKNSSNAESFSKVLFRALGYPEVKADQDSSITMHQVLRLLYIDQISRTTSLMREEDWDSPIIRNTISELLFGVYDDSLYKDHMDLRQRKLELSDVTQQLKHVRDTIWAVDQDLDESELRNRIEAGKKELDAVNSAIEEVLINKTRIRDTSTTETEKLRMNIKSEKKRFAKIKNYIESLRLETADSEEFLHSLNNRLKSIEQSLEMQDSLGDLPNCPLCHIPLEKEGEKLRCSHSGKTIVGDFGKSKMLKMREELRYQISESEELQSKRFDAIRKLSDDCDTLEESLKNDIRTYNQKVNSIKSARDNRLDELYLSKGRLESNLDGLMHFSKIMGNLDLLELRKRELEGYVGQLEEDIVRKQRKQRSSQNFSQRKYRMECKSLIFSEVQNKTNNSSDDKTRPKNVHLFKF